MAYAGKVVLITGGSSGIGLGIVKSVLAQGAHMAILDRNAPKDEQVVQALSDKKAAFFETDAGDWESQYKSFAQSAQTFGGRIDYVLANAGISQMNGFRQWDPTFFATSMTSVQDLAAGPPDLSVMRVNMTGVLYTVHLALAYFRQQSPDENGWRGKIILTGSSASVYACPNDVLYGASKFGVLGLTKGLGCKVLPEGITVNAFAPSVVRTNLGPPDFFDRLEKEGRVTPMSTVTRCIDQFLDPKCKISGALAELGIEEIIIRKPTEFLTDIVRQNMDEFHPNAEVEQALRG